MELNTIWSLVEYLLQLSMLIMIGLYFIFSNTIMRALAKFESGADIMVAINKEILNPTFLMCFFISAAASAYFALFAEGFLATAGAIFFLGTFIITLFFNVPLNNKLRDFDDSNKKEIWQQYLAKWTFWNHVRTISAIVSGLFISL